MNAITPKPARQELISLVKECQEQHEGDAGAAAEALYEAIRARPDLYQALADEMVWDHCSQLIHSRIGSARQSAWAKAVQAPSGVAQQGEGVRVLAGAMAGLMDNFPLPSGLLIGNATRDDLLSAADMWLKRAGTMQARAEFVRRVAERVTGEKRVRDVLKESDLIAIKASVEAADA
ncbi:hypothetical protein [Methylobacterium dankookense]|uniref:Uncharacterized protein n=1 Tax=Methylobacterium dankookense TaxID=560405 RepID=A0A564G6K8_9HYPH|nr:hypothetical protein [Methylobacterium dankookense]GJD58690.1 hypothetical protein IFDJLNFL_4613 [Methylobacterium dankookense]VUF15181.1 hypothetical protein MTDSW087_04916 [Methylobacterium dankookense]